MPTRGDVIPDQGSKGRQSPRRLTMSDINVVDRQMLKKALGGTIVGNTMEWYDVGVFGYLITTMGPVFLPEADRTVQTLFLLGTFAATFVARPIGGIVFGRLGDKVGRQKVLAATLMLMAASTFAVGLLPGYAQIGAWAAALLVLLKLVQGFSTGGEYAGATTFVCEYAPDKRRGFFASFLDMGSYIGFALGAALVSVLQVTLGQAAMEEWGWRLPFLVAGPLGLVAIYFRNKIEESPQFQATLDAQESAAVKAAAAEKAAAKGSMGIIKTYWRPIVLAMILAAAANTVGYVLTSYMPTYLTESKGYDPIHGTLLTLPVLVVMSLCIPLTGKLSDRIGRRPVLWIGAGSTILFAMPAFVLIGIGDTWSTLAGLVPGGLPRDVLCGQPRLSTAGAVPDFEPLQQHGHRLQLFRGDLRRDDALPHPGPHRRQRRRHGPGLLPHGDLDHRRGRHLFPPRIRPPPAARFHTECGYRGRGAGADRLPARPPLRPPG